MSICAPAILRRPFRRTRFDARRGTKTPRPRSTCTTLMEIVMLGTILLVLLILLLIGAIPAWPYSRSWGYAPGGFVSVLLIVVVVLLITGRI